MRDHALAEAGDGASHRRDEGIHELVDLEERGGTRCNPGARGVFVAMCWEVNDYPSGVLSASCSEVQQFVTLAVMQLRSLAPRADNLLG